MEVRMGGVQFREGAPGVLQAPVCICPASYPLGKFDCADMLLPSHPS